LAATPSSSTNSTIRVGDKEVSVSVSGVGAEYFITRNSKLLEGRFFDQRNVDDLAQVAVVDETARKTLFPHEAGSVVGKTMLLSKVRYGSSAWSRPRNAAWAAPSGSKYTCLTPPCRHA
jgi:macrolide transport system ATP-binding/permease protein